MAEDFRPPPEGRHAWTMSTSKSEKYDGLASFGELGNDEQEIMMTEGEAVYRLRTILDDDGQIIKLAVEDLNEPLAKDWEKWDEEHPYEPHPRSSGGKVEKPTNAKDMREHLVNEHGMHYSGPRGMKTMEQLNAVHDHQHDPDNGYAPYPPINGHTH